MDTQKLDAALTAYGDALLDWMLEQAPGMLPKTPTGEQVSAVLRFLIRAAVLRAEGLTANEAFAAKLRTVVARIVALYPHLEEDFQAEAGKETSSS